MTRDEFGDALQFGLGRAVLHARSHYAEELREIILDACLYCGSYDVQVEGTRAPFMYEIVSALPDREFYCDAVLRSLAEAEDDTDGVQRFRLATFLAEDKYPGAREALYRHFQPWHTWGDHVAYGFVDLDGVDGLLFLAGKVGEALAKGQNAADLGWVVRHAYETLGKQNCLDALSAAAGSNPHIAAFVRELPKFDRELDSSTERWKDVEVLEYEDLVARMSTLTRGHLMSWGKKTSEGNLLQAAVGLVAAADAASQLKHLYLFTRQAFPLDPGPLLELAWREDTARAAIVALAHVSGDRVRELAMDLMRKKSVHRGLAIDLLLENFQPADHAMALQWFLDEEDEEVIHSLGMGLEDLWERHPAAESATEMRKVIYENGPCSVCRGRAVRRMIESGTLPDAYREECAFDCNDEIRELVGASQEGDAPASPAHAI